MMNKLERLLLGLVVLEIPIQVDTYLFFQERWADFGAIGGINLSISTICIAALYVMWLAKYAVAAGYSGGGQLNIDYAPTAYLCLAIVSLCVAHNVPLALNSVVLLIHAYLIYVYVSNRVQSRGDVVFVVSMLLVALAMQGAIMVGLYVAGREIHLGPITGMISEDFRVGGTIGSPVTGASYLALFLAPALAVLATPISRRYKWLAGSAIVLGSVALLLTLTRGAWVAFAISVALFLLFAWYRRLVSLWMPAACVVSLVVVGIVFHESIAGRLLGDDEGSAESRVPLMHLALNMISEHPVTGVGTNNASVAGLQDMALPDFRSEWFYTIHNKYLLEWVELGVLGLAAFLWFLLSTIRSGWSTWQRNDRLLAPLALGLILAIVGQMVHMSVDVFNSRPQVQSLWLCAGLVIALGRMEGRGSVLPKECSPRAPRAESVSRSEMTTLN
jgi:putative inorganic carbon (hco3(-)) transporter